MLMGVPNCEKGYKEVAGSAACRPYALYMETWTVQAPKIAAASLPIQSIAEEEKKAHVMT